MLPIFYINLATRPDRRRYMENQFATLGLTATRIEAVTPAAITSADKASYCDPSQPTFLRENELACTLSHELAWRTMLERGHKSALFLEDDAELSELLLPFLAEAPDLDIDLVRIEAMDRLARVYPAERTGASGVSVRRFRSTPMGSAGYILRASAAEKLLASPHLRKRPIDLALYNPFEEPGKSLTRALTDPALCRQLGYDRPNSPDEGRSDLAHTPVRHEYAERHPVRFLSFRMRKALQQGLRNTLDHLAQRRNGLERCPIVFQRAGSTTSAEGTDLEARDAPFRQVLEQDS